jgi:hypothetical protein
VVEALTGLPPAEADRLRKRLADPEQAADASAVFAGLCDRKGVGRAVADAVLAQVLPFRDYAFCKSHAVSYGLIAWREAYIKAHHPGCFWAAVMNHHKGDYPRRAYVEDAKRSGLCCHLPCANRSQATWTQEVAGIRAGLMAVRGLDHGACEALLEERARNGPFRDLADLQKRITLPPRALNLLIRAGAFDFAGRSRTALLRESQTAGAGIAPLTEAEPWPLDNLPAGYTPAAQWREEWQVLGFLAGPSLMGLARACVPAGLADSRGLVELAGERTRLAGLLVTPAEEVEAPCRLTLEDEWGLIEVRPKAGTVDLSRTGLLVLAEGVVEEQHGVPLLVDARLGRALPATLPEAAGKAEPRLKVVW